jgi:hypothetical protein
LLPAVLNEQDPLGGLPVGDGRHSIDAAPQVFALQQGTATIGLAASEKQAIDVALESLAQEDPRFWSRADLYWNARGGSHTDGGAFLFAVHANDNGKVALQCTDTFGRSIEPAGAKRPLNGLCFNDRSIVSHEMSQQTLIRGDLCPSDLSDQVCQQLPMWD